MNYLAITFLVLVVFFLLGNKRLDSFEEITKDVSKIQEIENIKNEIIYINNKEYDNLEKILFKLNETKAKYIIYGDINNLNNKKINTLIANYITQNKNTCGFEFQCEYINNKEGLKALIYKLFAACLNYVQMLSKEERLNYSIIIGKTEDFVNDIQKDNIINFTLSPILSKRISKDDFKDIILKKHKLRLKTSISMLLTVLAGTVVTANTIYTLINAINLKSSFFEVIACALIYVCYANITVEIYKPMGIFKAIASYLFPLYIVVFIFLTTYYYIKNIVLRYIKMDNKKRFFVSLVILILVYILFILIKV